MIEILAIAIAIDLIIGEPKFHLITYFAKVVEFFDRKYKRRKNFFDIVAGSFLTIFIIFSAFLIVFFVNNIENYYLRILLLSYLLKISFSIRSLFEHVNACLVDDIEELRKNVGKIVSRRTENLSKGHLYSASIESLADNVVDAVIAPLFYFTLFGVYGAFIYRVVNLLDSLIGYRDDRYVYFGKLAARLDDFLNFFPSRFLLAVFLIYYIKNRRIMDVFKYKFKVNYLPISLYAFLLNVRLEKIGVYSINETKEFPKKKDLKRAISLTKKIVVFYILFLFVLNYMRFSA